MKIAKKERRGVVDEETKDFFIVPIKCRTREVLFPIIYRYVLPGSTIISDKWSAYRQLSELGYVALIILLSYYYHKLFLATIMKLLTTVIIS